MGKSLNSHQAQSPFHVAFGIDGHYFRYAGITITSILENNTEENFVFHILTSEIPPGVRKKYQELEERYATSILFHVIDESRFKDCYQFSSFSQYSPAIFTRLLIPDVLKGIAREVLYLDADILCVGSIVGLYELDMSDKLVAVVSDHLETTVKMRCAALGLRDNRYFNSGVLYMNIDNWRAANITDEVMRIILTSEQKLVFPDQDALNMVVAGQACFIDERWNFRYNLECMLNAGEAAKWLPGEVVFLHFTGRVKPWHDWNLHVSKEMFTKYLKLSPWAHTLLDAPRNYKEMRMYAGFLKREKKWLISFFWYMKYFFNKIRVVSRV